MASGGIFTPGIPKIRPGTYINFKAEKDSLQIANNIATVVIPFFNPKYGPLGAMLTFNKSSIADLKLYLGYDITDNELVLIREAFKGCSEVKVYCVGSGGAKATATAGGVTATARYEGERGNDFSYSIVANPISGFDVNVFVDTVNVATYPVENASDVVSIKDDFIIFTAEDEAEISAVAGTSLSGGTNATSSNSEFTEFLDTLDYTAFNTVALPIDGSTEDNKSLCTAFVSKIKSIRDKMGKTIVGVVANYQADNYAIINVANAPIVDGVEFTPAMATAFVAGISAGADEITSNTNIVYSGAEGFTKDNILSHEAVEQAITEGKFVFTLSEQNEVVCEYDINSLTTVGEDMNDSYKKNKIIRILDAVANAIKTGFPTNRYSNNETDYDSMDGLGMTILTQFEENGAIKNVSEGDFAVDRINSSGDSAFFNVAIQPVDSIEKLYFSVAVS